MWPSTFLMTGVLPYADISGLKVYQTATCTFQVKLNATQPYTTNDTLFLAGFNAYYKDTITGPFTSVSLYTITHNILTPDYVHSGIIRDSTGISYKIGAKSPWIIKGKKLNPLKLMKQ